MLFDPSSQAARAQGATEAVEALEEAVVGPPAAVLLLLMVAVDSIAAATAAAAAAAAASSLHQLSRPPLQLLPLVRPVPEEQHLGQVRGEIVQGSVAFLVVFLLLLVPFLKRKSVLDREEATGDSGIVLWGKKRFRS